MGLKSIGDIEELYLKYEKNFILEEQIELKDSDVDYYGQGASIVALTNFVLKNN
jgi:hypothetical protein